MPDLMDEMKGIVKGGLVNGPTLYLTGKLVDVSDQAAYNMLGTGLPDMVRLPLVGLALATIPVAMSQHWLAEKASEYLMANAVANALSVAGSAPNVDSGPLDQQINAMLLPIANVGLPAGAVPFTAAAFWGTPVATTKGYIPNKAPVRGYVAAPATKGYVPAPGRPGRAAAWGTRAGTGAMAGYLSGKADNMSGPIRAGRLRGWTTELK